MLSFCCTFLDGFQKATKRLKRAEITSDLQTGLEDHADIRFRRKILKKN